jgi:hypothetical protein
MEYSFSENDFQEDLREFYPLAYTGQTLNLIKSSFGHFSYSEQDRAILNLLVSTFNFYSSFSTELLRNIGRSPSNRDIIDIYSEIVLMGGVGKEFPLIIYDLGAGANPRISRIRNIYSRKFGSNKIVLRGIDISENLLEEIRRYDETIVQDIFNGVYPSNDLISLLEIERNRIETREPHCRNFMLLGRTLNNQISPLSRLKRIKTMMDKVSDTMILEVSYKFDPERYKEGEAPYLSQNHVEKNLGFGSEYTNDGKNVRVCISDRGPFVFLDLFKDFEIPNGCFWGIEGKILKKGTRLLLASSFILPEISDMLSSLEFRIIKEETIGSDKLILFNNPNTNRD